MSVFQLPSGLPLFPDPDAAEPDGLLAVGGDLSPQRLLAAYQRGIFPWYEDGQPILWWSPDPRLVLFPEEFHVSRRLRRTLRQGVFTVQFDTAFAEVIRNCAEIRTSTGEGTWITQEMQDAYNHMHELGYAHSVEVWQERQLVGGVYGISLGRCFFGESMFSCRSNASKIALATLSKRAAELELELIDCQMTTRHLLSLGARELPRHEFLRLVQEGMRYPTRHELWS